MRAGLGAHAAVLPETIPDALDAFRAPLSAIARRADGCRAVRRAGRRAGAGRRSLDQGGAAARRAGHHRPSRGAARARVLITDDAEHAAWLARDIGAEAAFYLPRTPNGRGVSDAWSCASDGEPADDEPTLLVVSGDEAASDPGVRALADRAEAVIGIGMFEDSFRGFCDLVLPGTSYLERDGTTVNLEGRLQRQRRAVTSRLSRRARVDREARRAFRGRPSRRTRSLVFEEVSRGLLRRHRLRRDRRAVAAPGAARARCRACRRRRTPHAGPRVRAATAALPPALQRRRGRADAGARVPAPRREIELSPADAAARDDPRGRRGDRRARTGRASRLRARIAATCPPAALGSRTTSRANCTRMSR